MRNQAEENGENEESERKKRSTEEITVRWNQEEENGRNREPSSGMLKLKWTKESRSHASAPEKKFKRGSPVEQLRERSRVERKETNSRAE